MKQFILVLAVSLSATPTFAQVFNPIDSTTVILFATDDQHTAVAKMLPVLIEAGFEVDLSGLSQGHLVTEPRRVEVNLEEEPLMQLRVRAHPQESLIEIRLTAHWAKEQQGSHRFISLALPSEDDYQSRDKLMYRHQIGLYLKDIVARYGEGLQLVYQRLG